MAIHVSLFAAFAEFAGIRNLEIEFQSGMSCSDLWNRIQQSYPRLKSIPPLFAVGDEYVPMDKMLNDGDRVLLFPPVSGGDSGFIFDSPLSVERALDAIRDEDGGGEAVFLGRVRKHNEEKTIIHLFYECQLSMAEKEIAKIIAEMKQKWPLKKVHIEHRSGRLEIGDIAVIVAVSAVHRREAMESCRYGIDELKRRVPIWKKEISESGEEWIGACDHTSQ